MQKQNFYTFPAVLNYADDGITISFPDFPGCLSCAFSDDEAVSMATDVLSLRLYVAEKSHENIPTPSNTLTLKKTLAENEIVILIRVHMPVIRRKSSTNSWTKHQIFEHNKKPGKVTVPTNVEALPELLANKIFEFTKITLDNDK